MHAGAWLVLTRPACDVTYDALGDVAVIAQEWHNFGCYSDASSVALRYDVALNWCINPFFRI
jgi:hypothetical protein